MAIRASRGVFQLRTRRGLLLSSSAMCRRSPAVRMERSVPLGEVLADQAVGVLVRAELPGCAGVTEVHGDARVGGELLLACHLDPAVPSDRLSKWSGEFVHSGGQCAYDALAAGTIGKVQQDDVAGEVLDERADVRTPAFAHRQVAIPVADRLSQRDLGRSELDGNHVLDARRPQRHSSLRSSAHSPSAQMYGQLSR